MDTPELPRNPKAEHEVLAALIIDPERIPEVCAVLRPEMLYSSYNQTLLRMLYQMDAGRVPIEMGTLIQWIDEHHLAEATGGIQRLGQLMDRYGSCTNVLWYANKIREYHVRRQIIAAADSCASMARDTDTAVNDVVEQVDACMVKATTQGSAGGAVIIGDGIEDTITRLWECSEAKVSINEPTGFPVIDKCTGGLGSDELWVIAGRPGMGKTALALGMALLLAEKGKDIVYFTMEMKRQKRLHPRMLSMLSGVAVADIKDPHRIPKTAWASIHGAADRIKKLPLFVDDTSTLTLERIRSVARWLHRQSPLTCVFVDYLQLMIPGPGSARKNKNDQLGEITRGLKQLASDVLGCPVVLLSQMNRAIENNPNGQKVSRGRAKAWRKPMLSDLRDSGSIEQDADLVGFLLDLDVPRDGCTRELYVVKQRDGKPNVSVPLRWMGECTRFEDPEWATMGRP